VPGPGEIGEGGVRRIGIGVMHDKASDVRIQNPEFRIEEKPTGSTFVAPRDHF
jgi:hypothetical protein